jgi:nitroreductase
MISTEDFNQLIKNRRSVYPAQYEQGKVIDDAIIEQILENANWAPTHAKTEPWRFVVFTGEGLKKLGQFQADLYKKVSEAKENFEENKYEKLLENPLKASHVIALGMKRNAKIPEIEEVEAVACAVQNMYLTATVYNVGAYWGSGGVTYYEEAKAFFGLEAEDKLLGFFYLGHIAKLSGEGKRNDVKTKTIWVR